MREEGSERRREVGAAAGREGAHTHAHTHTHTHTHTHSALARAHTPVFNNRENYDSSLFVCMTDR